MKKEGNPKHHKQRGSDAKIFLSHDTKNVLSSDAKNFNQQSDTQHFLQVMRMLL